MTHSHKTLNIVKYFLIALSYMYTLVAAMCAALLDEFRTSANLTGFHVFALKHVFAQLQSLFFKLSLVDWSFYNRGLRACWGIMGNQGKRKQDGGRV